MNPQEAKRESKMSFTQKAKITQSIKQPQADNPEKQLQKVVQIPPEPQPFQRDYSDPQVKAYFWSRMPKQSSKNTVAVNIITQQLDQTIFFIKEGYLRISQQSSSVSQIIKQSDKITKEQAKIKQIIDKKDRLEKQLFNLSKILGSSSNGKIDTKSKQIKDSTIVSPQHKNFVERMVKARKAAQQKRRLRQQYEQKRDEELKKKEEVMQNQMKLKGKVERQQFYRQRIQQKSKLKEKEKEENLESIKRYKSVSQQKRLHQLMQEHYMKNIVMPSLEERKKLLEQKRKLTKPIDIEAMRQFQEQYLAKRQALIQEKGAKREQQLQKWTYEPPSCSQKILKIMQEERIHQKLKEQEKKRALQEKLSRQNAFSDYLKQKFRPKVDQKKVLQIEPKAQIKLKVCLPRQERSKIGDIYLAEAKTKAIQAKKKQNLSARAESKASQDSRKSSKAKANRTLGHMSTISVVESQKRRLERIMQTRMERGQKLKYLRYQAERLGELAHRKQQIVKAKYSKQDEQAEIQFLLGSIKAKVGIINLYKK